MALGKRAWRWEKEHGAGKKSMALEKRAWRSAIVKLARGNTITDLDLLIICCWFVISPRLFIVTVEIPN